MNDKTRIVRDYQDADKQAVLKVYNSAILESHRFLEENVRLQQRNLMEESIDDSTNKALVLEENGHVVGFATFITETAIAGFFIDPSLKARGLGRYLIEYIQSKKKEISLVVYKRNTRGVRFYRNNGFRQTNKKYEKDANQEYLEMTWRAARFRNKRPLSMDS